MRGGSVSGVHYYASSQILLITDENRKEAKAEAEAEDAHHKSKSRVTIAEVAAFSYPIIR